MSLWDVELFTKITLLLAEQLDFALTEQKILMRKIHPIIKLKKLTKKLSIHQHDI